MGFICEVLFLRNLRDVDKLANFNSEATLFSHLASIVNVLSIQLFKPHNTRTCPTTVLPLHVATPKGSWRFRVSR